ncbi:MAG: YhdH/YhfP family quinone oxidoreductase [SAR324 cluster bacterium]|jgi:putative YhdH/YhfP family quinone oxidoreductase|nr:YhdH/YhfP family quinone oxidoreductase [SAR324 cluster bacterium]MCH2266281.1 YhdH/YhfP family quinone oxidoreductase [SAR324 cluster bacterium]
MSDITFRAMVVSKTDEKTYTREVTERSISDLPEGEVLVRVRYSSLNFKDGLSCIGNPGVTRNYPHTPGIDASGEVAESSDSRFKIGDSVIVTSYDLGMSTSGGFGQYIRVPAEWVVPLPEGLSLKDSMIFGTAGYTAALSVHALQKHGITPEQGEIVVTGSTGGVGSVAVALLSHLGYTVVASTGKKEETDFLKGLGAAEIVSREEVNDESKKPLLRERWAGAVDTVGGTTLAALLKATKRGGAVAATGLVASAELSTTVFPFILRGVSLLGIDSGFTPTKLRRKIWNKLAGIWKFPQLEQLKIDCTLEELDPEIDKILAGGQRGRVVVDLE